MQGIQSVIVKGHIVRNFLLDYEDLVSGVFVNLD